MNETKEASIGRMQAVMRQNASALCWGGAMIMGVALVGVGAYAVWNSRQAKMLRAAKRTSLILNKTATILQSISTACEW